MIQNQTNPADVPPPGPPPRIPASSPRSAETPPSAGAFTVVIAICGGIALAISEILKSGIFPPDSGIAKALVIASGILSAALLGLVYVAKRISKEADSQEFSYRLERDEIRAKNPQAFADVEDEDDEP